MNRSKRLTQVRQLAVAAVSLLGVGALAGCGVSGSTPSTNFNPTPTIQGQAVAGRNYLVGAHVTFYSTASTGTWDNTIGAYKGTAKVLGTTTTNGVGAYQLTGLSCSSPDMVYVVIDGGRPFTAGVSVTSSIDSGLPNNSNSLMMTAIGDCSVLSGSQVQAVVTNEASTVAAVEALQRFMTVSGTTVNVVSSSTNYAGASGTGTAASRAGLKHAFATAQSLSDYRSAAFNQNTNSTAQNYGGVIPVQTLNALAYSQYLCTIGGDDLASAASYPYCNTLFTLATPPGGTKPATSLEAMLNIARNPTNNAAALLTFSLTKIPFSTNGSVRSSGQLINDGIFVPALSTFNSIAADFSIGIQYPKCYGSNPVASGDVTGGFSNGTIPTVACAVPSSPATGDKPGLTYPLFLTLDSNDNVYVSNPQSGSSTYGTLLAMDNTGNILWSTAVDKTNRTTNPKGIAVDDKGHVFVANYGTGAASFIEIVDAASGNQIQKLTSSLSNITGLAVDPLGNVYYGSTTVLGAEVKKASLSGTTYVESSLNTPATLTLGTFQIALDSNANIWAEGSATAASQVYYVANTGTVAAPAYTLGTKTSVTTAGPTQGIAVDAAGNSYIATSGTGTNKVVKTTVTGSGATALPTSTVEATTATTNATRSLYTDGSGKIWWLENSAATKVYSYVPGSGATPQGYLPCYYDLTTSAISSNTVQYCTAGLTAKIDLAIDSSGNVWIANATSVASSTTTHVDAVGGTVVEMVGLAAPTVPNRSLLKVGIIP